jgi:hypothetical protein
MMSWMDEELINTHGGGSLGGVLSTMTSYGALGLCALVKLKENVLVDDVGRSWGNDQYFIAFPARCIHTNRTGRVLVITHKG